MFDKMFTKEAFDNLFEVLPRSGESWLCIFIVMFVLIVFISLLGLVKTDSVELDEEQKKRKKGTTVLCVVLAAAVAISGVALIAINDVPVDKLCAEGKYQAAYEKASAKQKDFVYAENALLYNYNILFRDTDNVEFIGGSYIEEDDDKFLVMQVKSDNDKKYFVLLSLNSDKEWDAGGLCSTSSIEAIAIRQMINDDNSISDEAVKRINDFDSSKEVQLIKK